MNCKLNHVVKLLSLTFFLSVISCDFNELPELPASAELPLENVKSLVVTPSLNKVIIQGTVEDENVKEIMIYWNDRASSVAVPVNVTNDGFTLNQEIENLSDKLYLFEVQTNNGSGKNSDFISAGTEVYGQGYLDGLENRALITSTLTDNFLSVVFESSNPTSGILGTEMIYENADGEQIEVYVETSADLVNISSFLPGSTIQYRSAYLFSPVSVDTAFTSYATHKPLVVPKLGNAAVPFVAVESSGRWGTLGEPWVTNDAAKNHDGLGGWDEWNGNIFNLESGWGAPHFTDGKIYQKVTVDPANYILRIEVLSTNHDGNADGAYFVITKGEGIPNVADVETATEVVGFERIGTPGTYNVEFTIDETTDISIGEVATQNGNHFCNITSWELLAGNN
ncbi:hypothetical protein PK35_06860 [Tamlana nanhaiensis]|uniref:DUF5013 domain-containing protein n=1 Tax=Neotamlana nanhaiensis TaxID=1382798 RepID=A0A0D7W382_9FLAO|nr:DUF4998 domain-containing protein [Tamlana nanhaiensis]KJD33556.1 hypothetical protein PK35_06860 [Tamlana nanhaiensis]